uniref:Phosphotransferase n=1 Tax=Kalanchoe fedtschenkoi TaxID=63787 RepID=A0A7N0VD76_KALFE
MIRQERTWWISSTMLWRNMDSSCKSIHWYCIPFLSFSFWILDHWLVTEQVDETTGDLAGGRYYSKDAIAAITLGMYTNAAYVAPARALPLWDGPPTRSGEMVLNMDWGGFVNSHLPISKFDAELDAESSDPACRAFEKLISGMYLGEIVRRVLLRMAQETALFGDSVPEKLRVSYMLRSPDMAAMHQDTSEDRQVVNEKLQEIFGISDSTPFAREVVADVCDIVAERAARLAGAGVVAIVKKLDRIKNKRSVIIVEGGLYEHYRVFRNYLHSSIWEMLGSELSDNVVIEHSHGGSGAGALFMAASKVDDMSSPEERDVLGS